MEDDAEACGRSLGEGREERGTRATGGAGPDATEVRLAANQDEKDMGVRGVDVFGRGGDDLTGKGSTLEAGRTEVDERRVEPDAEPAVDEEEGDCGP